MIFSRKPRFVLPLAATVAVALAAVSDETHGPRFLEQPRVPPRQTVPKASIRVNVELTMVPVTVTDRFGRAVAGFEKKDFNVYDEKERREIVFFSGEDAPASVGLVFDSSGSMKSNMMAAHEAVRVLMQTLEPEDEALVVTVASRPTLASGFTTDIADMQNAVLFSPAKGQTALVDGVYLALSRMPRGRNPRKALVVVSDGLDNHSRYTLNELMSYAVEADAQIYTIGLHGDPSAPGAASDEAEGEWLLKTMSERTGGVHYNIGNAGQLPGAMANVARAIHNLYVLGYYPPEDAPPGKYRKIRVELNAPQGKGAPRLQVYSRRGYYAPQS